MIELIEQYINNMKGEAKLDKDGCPTRNILFLDFHEEPGTNTAYYLYLAEEGAGRKPEEKDRSYYMSTITPDGVMAHEAPDDILEQYFPYHFKISRTQEGEVNED